MTDQTQNKILIVDDDQFLLDIYTTKFKQGNFDVETAESGEIALEKIKEKNYNAILLDIVMPSMDGITLLQKMREGNLAQGSAVIVLSNQGQQEDIERAKQFDIDGYIVKASTIPSEVLEEVTAILAKKKPANA